MTRPNSAALIIGVADYSIYDASAGQPDGTSDLLGSHNDVAAIWTLLRELNVPGPNIIVLTDAAGRGEPDARPRRVGNPTRQAILEGVAELARTLAGDGPSQGFLYFSGHGADLDGPVLCASDTHLDAGGLNGVVSMEEIKCILEAEAPQSSVTAIIESCHSGGVSSARSLLTTRTLTRVPELRPQDTVLAACGESQSAQESVLAGRWYGAFTWALLRVLEQYARRPVGHFLTKDIAARSLVHRAGKLLSALGFHQRPQCNGQVAHVLGQPAGVPPVAAHMSRRDGSFANEEIWAGDNQYATFILKNDSGSTIGYLVSTLDDFSSWEANKDYWKWTGGTSWPSKFRLVWDEYASAPDVMFGSSPTGFEAQPLVQFEPNSSSFNLSGQTVWGISSDGGTGVSGYLARKPDPKVGWFSTNAVSTGEDPPLAVWMLTSSSQLVFDTAAGSTSFTAYPSKNV